MKNYKNILNIRILVYFPFVVYLLSYLYLAYYHRTTLLFNTIIHEGGEYTLLETIFYASHFLGHIPVHTTIAFLFVGFYIFITDFNTIHINRKKITIILLAITLVLFLVFSLILSNLLFGVEDTYKYMNQKKQSLVVMNEGGSWNLHYPSTIMLFLLIPIYIYSIKKTFHRKIVLNTDGLLYLVTGFIIFVVVSVIINPDIVKVTKYIWSNPRYMGHSIRELLTFPLTYFPIPLYFILKRECQLTTTQNTKTINIWILFIAMIFIIGLCYQSFSIISAGIGETAQQPSFARNGKLPIIYLLSSHYFEHILDTIYFSLISTILFYMHFKRRII